MESLHPSIHPPVCPPASQLINKNAHFSPLKSSSSDVIADGLFASRAVAEQLSAPPPTDP